MGGAAIKTIPNGKGECPLSSVPFLHLPMSYANIIRNYNNNY